MDNRDHEGSVFGDGFSARSSEGLRLAAVRLVGVHALSAVGRQIPVRTEPLPTALQRQLQYSMTPILHDSNPPVTVSLEPDSILPAEPVMVGSQ
jgi:hypothetical protein